MKIVSFTLGIVMILLLISAHCKESAVPSSDVEAVKNKVEKPVRDAISIRQDTQQKREEWMEERDTMLRELERLEKENQELTERRDQLASKVSATRERITNKENEHQGVKQISEDIRPFLEETLAWLASETKSGLPFLAKERRDRVTRLQALMDDPDVPVNRKFRKIMEALLIEAEYGTTVEVSNETIELDGEPVLVNILRLGRLNLFFQTLNGNRCGLYNMATSGWEELPREENRNIKMAADMALKRRPVEFVNLPVGRVVVQ